MTTQTAQPGTCNIPNRTIFEGDNLDVMRGMNDGCVDLIYLDPPFNSNRDYAAPIGSEAAGDSALRFGHWFGVEPQFWLNLQSQFDLAVAERKTGDAVRGLPTAVVG